ncbi:MAG: T9SS type A sorting domain-containing protein [Bacteroidetes bacterium]|nr:T9SS type A sorting domain-containing protein [Bacteroidota bacterium]
MSDVVDYPVVNNVLSSENDLLTYDFVPAADTILVNGNNLIAFVAVGTDVTALVSVFTVSDYAELFVGTTPQVSGVTTNNFTTPVVYTVEAEDGSTQDYTVTVRFWYNLPYTQDFEGIDDWTTNAPTTDWVKGTPAKIQIVGAHSGANAYITNLSTVYTTSRTSTLTSPYFNAMNLSTSPKLTFFSNFKTEEDWDAGVVEISLNDGPWVRLDSVLGTGPDFATPNSYNWYNADNIDGPIDGPKFTGSSTNYGTAANGWIQSKTNLVAGKYFRIRFKFSSDSSTNDEGWAVDDINISLPAANDVGVIAILAPVDGCGHTNADTVTIQVVNFGTDAQTDIPVGYSLDGGTTIVSESISGTLNPGDTVQYTFTTPADLTAAGSYDMGATTFLTSDADASNDLTTLMLNVIGEISSFPYIENFEDNMAEYFNIEEDTYSNTYFRTQGANTMFVMEGGSANTNWTGTGGSITYNNAWVATTEHQAGAYTCDIDASSVTDLALKLDIKQNNTYGYTDYSWFRVLANGTVIHDVNGDSTFKANVSTGEPFHTLQFDLSGFAGTQFVLRMESSCKYNSDYDGSYPEGDNVILDNIILYVPAGNDVGVSSVINPVSSLCGDLQDSLLVIVSNFGTTDVSDIPVEADVTKPDLSVQHLSGTYAGPLVAGASDTLYMGTINTTATGDYLVTAYTALDQDTTHYNDTTHAIFNVLPPLALPYTEDFEGTVDGWASNMALSSGHGNTSTVLYDNMWSSNTEVYALSPKVGEIQAGDMLSFEYRITNYTGGGATTLNGDTLLVGIYDCDAMYLGHMITQANHTPSTEMQLVTVDLTPFAGSNIQVYFDMIWGAGDYYIDIDNINIMTPMAPVVEIGNDTTICDGQLLALDAGNQPYSSIIWQQNGLAGDTISTAQTANITESGLYVVSVENAYGLTTIDSLTVTVNALPVVDIGSDVSLCENDTTTLDGGTFANYFWLDASNGDTLAVTQTYDAAATGDYILAASDIYGCENTDTVTVTVNPPPAIDLGNDTVLCTATSITLDAGAGMTYLWSDNTMNQTVVLTASDTISVIIFDTVTTCSNSDMIVVIFSPAITVDLGSDTTICADYVVTLDGGTHDSYLWTEQISGDTVGAAATYDVIQTGTYILEATNSLGCSKTDTVAITVNALPIVNLGNDTALCVAGSLILDAGAGFNYLWDDSSTNQTLTVSTDDTASVVITDPGTGCTNSDEIIVLFNPIVDVNLGADTITVCGNVLLDAGYFVNASYIWTETASTDTIGNIQTFDAAMAGTYIVEVTNTCGSSDLDSVTVNINALPTATISADPLVCAGSMDTLYISFTGQGPWDILVSANATTVPVNNIATSPFSTVLTPGAATTITILSVTDAYGCTATNTDTFLINVNPLPVVELGANPTSCDVDTITLDAGTNGVTYEWSVGGLTTQVVNLTVADLGIGAQGVGVTVTDVNGCENSDFVLATFVATPVFSLGSDEVACETEIVHLDASAISGSYLWMPGNYTTATVDYDVNDLGIGTSVVSLTVTTNGCAAQDSVQITFNSSPVVYLGPDTTICDYSAITLDAENPGSTYVWSVAGETAQTLVVDTSVAVYGPNTISVVVTNTDACSATDNVVVTIDNCVGVSETTASDMFNYYPNPVNDVLRIELGQKYQDASVSILDAQGKLVYSEVVSGTSNIQVEVKSLAAGVYTLRVIVADQVHTGLISVE